ncbi:MAG TPA: hypothetical protein VFE23_12885 [Usitatibacter sp.]|jgi:hypothetical protein|nr:hypothetical protein [Usitatibacter sp.]
MNHYRFVSLPSNDSVATGITLAVCTWFTVAAGYMLTDRADTRAVDNVQHAVLMEEAAPSSPTPLPVAAAPDVTEKIVVEARRVRVS